MTTVFEVYTETSPPLEYQLKKGDLDYFYKSEEYKNTSVDENTDNLLKIKGVSDNEKDIVSIFYNDHSYNYNRGELLRRFPHDVDKFIILFDKTDGSNIEKVVNNLYKQNIFIDEKSTRYLKMYNDFIIDSNCSKKNVCSLEPIKVFYADKYDYILDKKEIVYDVSELEDVNNFLDDMIQIKLEKGMKKGFFTYVKKNLSNVQDPSNIQTNYAEFESDNNAKITYLKIHVIHFQKIIYNFVILLNNHFRLI
jgi:hypothetical protein